MLSWEPGKKRPGATHQCEDKTKGDLAGAIDLGKYSTLWPYKAPLRLVKIAYKKVAGYALTDRERAYLKRFRKNGRRTLF